MSNVGESALFVFGSFSEGMFHYRKIESYVTRKTPARACGALYRLPSGMPVLSLDGDQAIYGSVITLEKSETLLSLLDQFHGVNRLDPATGLFLREKLPVVLESDEVVTVETYVIQPNRLASGARPIAGGNWRQSLEQEPPLFQRLSAKQSDYIKKLGACGNRDLVPIDLVMYRDLIRMGIAIDKGRRLALTSLGQEICRMLS